MNQSSKCKTEFSEMFCMKCREARPVYQKQIVLEQVNKSVRAKGHCRSCKTVMNKTYKLDDVPRLRTTFRVGEVLELYDCETSPVNTHLQGRLKMTTSEPLQWELFT
jgi:hypothetical protein